MWEALQLHQGATTLGGYCEYDQLQTKIVVGRSPKMMKIVFCFFTVKSIKYTRNCGDILEKIQYVRAEI